MTYNQYMFYVTLVLQHEYSSSSVTVMGREGEGEGCGEGGGREGGRGSTYCC